ncbi:MAG: polymer-forming cytoskeletal protein [Magnetovibrio sp.]|nr:polymer-forming cytoskeletal protein [Magnetovibrio sp.]
MFGKKKEGGDSSGGGGADKPADMTAAPPLKPFSKKGSHAPAKPPTATSFQPEVPRRVPDIPGAAPRRVDRPLGAVGAEPDSSRLVVGRDISLNGEITACEKLVVEGRVEAVLSNARVIEVAPTGFFKGSAEVEEADISGRYEGDLVARERLVVRAGGHIKGKVRYGRIVIESGGEVSGDMQTLDAGAADGGDNG